jgi:AraC-like DNA-binding protein
MIKLFKPKSGLLLKYIKGYSVFEKDCNFHISFISFPHEGPALALWRNAESKIEKKHLEIIPTKNNHYNTVVIGKYTSPVYITYNGYVDEICINFTPLGINYFFNDYYSKIAPENFQNIRSRSWIDFLPELFSISNSIEQIKLLENFLINQFRKLNLEKLQHAINLFMDKNRNYKVLEVADITGINEKTMRRMFNKYIGCSPVAFKRISRFRNTINIKLMSNKFCNLTQVGHKSFFYDSSHFVREYKKFAEKNPKTFFNNVSFLGNKSYPCIFM